MATENCGDCFFRQLIDRPDSVSSLIVGITGMPGTTDQEPTTEENAVRALDALAMPVCPVQECYLTTDGILRYIASAGDATQIQQVRAMVAADCELRVPLDDEELA
jgi:hypothetical protein